MRYAVEVARPVYRRTKGYGEAIGLDDAVEAIAAREIDPYAAAGDLVRRFVQEGPDS